MTYKYVSQQILIYTFFNQKVSWTLISLTINFHFMKRLIPPMLLLVICFIFQTNNLSAQTTDARCVGFDIEISTQGIPCDQSRGEIEVKIIGGRSGEYVVEWDNVGGSIWNEKNTFFPFYTISNLPPSTYKIKVRDFRTSCVVEKMITLDKGSLPEDLALSGNAVGCNGMGSISINIPNNKPPFNISLCGPVNASYIANSRNFRIYSLPAGEYQVHFEEDGCTAITSTVVPEGENLPKMAVRAIQGNCSISTGAVVIDPSGGEIKEGYTLSWEGPTKGSTAVSKETELTGFITGEYTFVLKDDNDCQAISKVNIDRSGLSMALTATQSNCNQNGSIKVDITSGVAPYTVNWRGGGSEGSKIVDDNSTTFSLAPGTYIVEVKDANGCSTFANASIINVPSDLYCSITSRATTCNEDNGYMKVFISGGKKPYTLSYTGPVSNTIEVNGTAYFHDLPAGLYTTFLQDAEGCSVAESNEVLVGASETAAASFTYSANGTSVFFFNNSSLGTYSWDLGDGTTTTDASPSHEYASSGSYEVCLTTTGSCGSNTICQTLQIAAFKDLSGTDLQAGQVSKASLNATTNAEGMRVAQNYPNPFVNQTDIVFELPAALLTTIRIHDNTGKVIKTHTAKYDKGSNLFTFNQNNLAAGVYYYTITSGVFSTSKKMLVK